MGNISFGCCDIYLIEVNRENLCKMHRAQLVGLQRILSGVWFEQKLSAKKMLFLMLVLILVPLDEPGQVLTASASVKREQENLLHSGAVSNVGVCEVL